jgi:hypothetical protein
VPLSFGGGENPNGETRNPNQIRMANDEKTPAFGKPVLTSEVSLTRPNGDFGFPVNSENADPLFRFFVIRV